MTHPKLTGTQSAVMFVLMAQAQEVRNPDLVPALDKSGRDKLNQLGLIDSVKANRAFVHSLTDSGWAWCTEELESGPPERATPQLKAMYTVLAGIGRYLRASDHRLHEIFSPATTTPSVERPVTPISTGMANGAGTAIGSVPPTSARIRETYRSLAAYPGGWVGLAELRSATADVDHDLLDAALVLLQREPGVSLIPQENQKILTDSDRHAAVVVGTQRCHLLAIEEL